jgi:regulator of cell morphogenesis and NO signaling
MMTFRNSQTLGEIVAASPKTADVFKTLKVDFCCGGHRTLAQAVDEAKLDGPAVLAMLEAADAAVENAQRKPRDWRDAKPSDLLDHIENTHHVFLRRALPELAELSAKIMRVHGPHHAELFRFHKLFSTLKADLEGHLVKEEELLFPAIREYAKAPSAAKLAALAALRDEIEREHVGAGDLLKEMRALTNDYAAPSDGCGSYVMTFDKMGRLEADLFDHIHLENNVLFPMLERMAS